MVLASASAKIANAATKKSAEIQSNILEITSFISRDILKRSILTLINKQDKALRRENCENALCAIVLNLARKAQTGN